MDIIYSKMCIKSDKKEQKINKTVTVVGVR